MDPVIILLIVVIAIITTLLVVVGIHVIQILREARKTIDKTNHSLDKINGILGGLHAPFNKQGGLIEGLKTGLNLAQAFAHWLSSAHLETGRKEGSDDAL